MKKNNRAFTLIELLAIIVILAIIAVITVPIILNIIENSRKGAATDSAYGYKDSINKYYISELQNHNKLKLDGTYNVNSDGSLAPTEDNEFGFGDNEYGNSLDVSVSGTIPSSGKLRYSNNVLNAGCLVIGDYKVTFGFDGKVNETVKGNCADYSFPTNESEQDDSNQTQSVVQLYESDGTTPKDKANVALEDIVKIGDEAFQVINTNKNGNIVLLAEYNLKEQSITNGTAWKQYTGGDYFYAAYSDNDFYGEIEREECVPSASAENGQACETISEPGYFRRYNTDSKDAVYVYRTSNNEDTSNNLVGPINAYKSYLNTTFGLNVLDVRLISYEEVYDLYTATEIGGLNLHAHDQTYLTGSECDYEHNSLFVVYTSNTYGCQSRESTDSSMPSNDGIDGNDNFGVRPVIEIPIASF